MVFAPYSTIVYNRERRYNQEVFFQIIDMKKQKADRRFIRRKETEYENEAVKDPPQAKTFLGKI